MQNQTQIPLTFKEVITTLQDYISLTKNSVITTPGELLFVKIDYQQKGITQGYTHEQLNQMQEVINYVEKQYQMSNLVESFVETIPKCVSMYKKLEHQDSPIQAAVLGQLVV